MSGPVSMTVRFSTQIDATNTITYETEFVVVDDEEAKAKGEQFAGLIAAFNAGVGMIGPS